jgi:hypothetical protein
MTFLFHFSCYVDQRDTEHETRFYSVNLIVVLLQPVHLTSALGGSDLGSAGYGLIYAAMWQTSGVVKVALGCPGRVIALAARVATG